ncbi:MAG: FtsQ-type POTRA domain-containing protein [Pyrinomonadaceae bacterium]|nr:FtsQ-type POTRA domain-containing protein [Acidobacteriota bacterium]MBP7475741.1 FtsQ-type POTRA domain-containing protein [Pyrinomonadaceae bacterium]MBP9110308.1 FtsQ-type POTRA domain-containing protein [Pyrinomonadaceae bacterium]
MAKRKVTTKARASSTKLRARKTSSRVRRAAALDGVTRFGLPLLISAVLIVGIAVVVTTFYSSATSSEFFNVRAIDIRGIDRTPLEDVKRVVSSEVEKPGVWNADLGEIKAKIEKFPFVKSAAVSRMLPAGIRVDVVEREPAAVVRLSSGDYLVDTEAVVLAKATAAEKNFPVVMQGWDESKTVTATPDNLARLKLYKKMLDEWKQFDLVSRVKEVNLKNARDPIATIEDSGRAITVSLAKDNLGKSLRAAVEAVSGKGTKVRSVNAEGVSPVITYLELGNE